MNDFLQQLIDWRVPIFKKYALEELEVFNDFHTVWEKKSGFPFLHLTSKEYYLQQFFEERLESFIRYTLIKNVLGSLLVNKGYKFKFLEPSYDGFKPNIWSNEECEQNIGFEFIEAKIDKKIGFRYTALPVVKKYRDKLSDIIQKEGIDEIVIIDWSLNDSFQRLDTSPYYPGINIRHEGIKDFFNDYLDEDLYVRFIQYLKDTVLEFQEYIGVVSIPRLTSPLLFKFRFEVEYNIISHLQQLEDLRSHYQNTHLNHQLQYAYKFIDPKNNDNNNYRNLEKRSLALLFNTKALKLYKVNKLYQVMIGRGSFARCLATSEYLYKNYGKSDLFDYTAVVSGYLKSVEQLMYSIALFSLDRKNRKGEYYQIAPKIGDKKKTIDFTSENMKTGLIDTTLGSLCFFFKNNSDLINIGGQYKKTLINCCFCYSEECRNDSFHKHNIDQWSRVETIRNNTFYMYLILLGCCKLGDNYKEAKEQLQVATDDRLSRIYYQLITHDTLDYFVQFNNGKTYEICRPREEEYPSFDEYGLLKNKELKLECEREEYSSLYDGTDFIIISDENMPIRIWYKDEDDYSKNHYFEY